MPRIKGGITSAEALETYASYHNRLSEWNALENAERAKILRLIYNNCKGVECLTPGCTTRLTTYNGMLYHLQYCGVPAKDRLKQCPICQEHFVSGEMRTHLKTHCDPLTQSPVNEQLSSYDVLRDNGRKRKSAVKAQEGFVRIAADLFGKNGEQSAVKSTPTRPSKKLIKVECGFDESDDDCYDDQEPEPSQHDVVDEQVERAIINKRAKKITENRRHKKFTILGEPARIEWKKFYKKAYEKIIADDHLKLGFEEWIIEFTSWSPLAESDTESYVANFKDKSIPFKFSTWSEPTRLNLLDSKITEYGAVGFCGSAIVACAWCPIPQNEQVQYIAVSTHIDENLSSLVGNFAGSIQLWACTFDSNTCTSTSLELLFVHDYGVVMDLRWCPSGIWQSVDERNDALLYSLPRLGALAATSGTGEIPIFGIPQPASLTKRNLTKPKSKEQRVKIYKVQPLIVLYCGARLVSYTLDWSHFNGHEKLAAGFHDGSVSIWNLKKPCELLRDSSNRLLAIITIAVSKSPIRCLRWYSSTKILVSSMDKRFSLWDIEDAVCLWTQNPQQFVLAIGSGPVYPGYLISSESSSQLPHYLLYTDAPTQSCLVINRFHQSTVLAAETSVWNGCVVAADNQGYVTLSCLKAVTPESSLKRKFVEKILMNTIYLPDQVPYTYEEAKNCTLEFNCEGREVKKDYLEEEFKRLELTGQYPLAALFAISWNPNENYSQFCCFGGETGLLFVCDTKM